MSSRFLQTVQVLLQFFFLPSLLLLTTTNSITFSVGADSHNAVEIDYSKIDVWGPGLKANAQLPTRYVYVQLYNKDGNRYAFLIGNDN